jgi:hypothetical protein
MHVSEYVSAEHSGLKDRFWFPYVVAALVGLCLVFMHRGNDFTQMWDVDDILRSLQVKALIETGNWFDRTLPFIEMPEPYISPWSRLVDLPYLLITWLFMAFMATENALRIAFLIWPPIMLIVYCVLAVEVQKRILPLGERLTISSLIISTSLMALAIWDFAPLRVDHHNMQLLLTMLMFLGLVLWSRIGGLVVASAVVLSVAVGLELLPLAAFVLAAVCLSWAFSRNGAAEFLHHLGLGIIVFTPLAALFLLGPTGMRQTACDAFSAPYILALMGFGFIGVVMPRLQSKAGAGARILALGFTGVVLLGVLALAFPLCLGGPYHMVDPTSRELWLDRVSQEQSILVFLTKGAPLKFMNLAAIAMIIPIAAPLVWQQWKKGFTGVAIVFLCGISCMILVLLQSRYKAFPAAIIPLFAPLAILYIRQASIWALQLLAVVTGAGSMLALSLWFLTPVEDFKPDAVNYVSYLSCPEADLSALDDLPPGRIMAPLTFALNMAGRLPPGMTVAGLSFHRASPAIKRVMETFILPDAAARKAALQPFDYLAVCRTDLPERIPSTTLFAKLTRGEKWPGLDVIETPATSDLRLFKIDHTSLQ